MKSLALTWLEIVLLNMLEFGRCARSKASAGSFALQRRLHYSESSGLGWGWGGGGCAFNATNHSRLDGFL